MQTLVEDSRAISLLKKKDTLTAQEKQELYNLIKDKEWSATNISYAFVYKVGDSSELITISRSEFEQWATAKDTYSATVTEDTNSVKQQKINIAIQTLRARRLDEADACNIEDPTTMISPCSCHYSKNDVYYLISNGYCKDYPEAYSVLMNNDRYKTLDAEVQSRINKGDIKLDKDSLLTYYGLTEEEITKNIQVTDINKPDIRYINPTQEQQQQAAAQNTTGEPRDCYSTTSTFTTAQGVTIIAENDFVQWLLESVNSIFRADTRVPQIPTSIGASIAMARGGNDTSRFGKYNFWQFPYDPALTSLDEDGELCAFNSTDEGIQAILTALHSKKYEGAISSLKEKMGDSSDADKDAATLAISIILGGNYSSELNKSALDYVKKYDMRKWDEDKTESEGGHSDTKKNSSESSEKVNNSIAKSVKRQAESIAEKGIGVLLKPMGPKHTLVIKLPKGKTPCEPIYPDLVTVGDTVPEWIFSESYAKMAKEAEEAALKAAGISTKSDEEIQLEYVNNKILAFKDQQFISWVQKKGLSYSNDSEKESVKMKYAEAAAVDPEHFTDGIWTPDEGTKNVYKALVLEKANLQYNGDTATARAHIKYLEAAQVTKQEISDRESSWNQDTGGTYSATTGEAVSTITPAKNASVEAYVSWAEAIARDQSHGYSQGAGMGNYTGTRTGPDYDCSSFVYYALTAGGFDVIGIRGYAGVADIGLWEDLSQISGWKRYNYADVKDSIQRGDILMRMDEHVAIAINATRTVEAIGVNAGGGSYETGDQDREIDFYNISGRHWDEVYRYQGS